MFCENCGNQISAGAKFCAKCGTPTIISPENPNTQLYSQNHNVDNNSMPAVQNDIPEYGYQQPIGNSYDVTGNGYNDSSQPGKKRKKKSKKKASKRIASFIAILVAVAFIFSGVYIFVIKEDDWYYKSKSIYYNVKDGEAEKFSETEYFENGLLLSDTTDGEKGDEYSYDKHGRISSMKSEEDGGEYSLEFEYSKDGKNYVASDSAELDSGIVEFEVTYDSNYNIISVTSVQEIDGEKTESKIECEYKNGREISRISYIDGEKRSEEYKEYYSNGKLKTETVKSDHDNYIYEYDKDGNKISETRYNDNGVEYKTESTYEKGRLIGEVYKIDGEKNSETKLDKKDDVYKFECYNSSDELNGYQYMYYEGKNLVKIESYDEDKNMTYVTEYEFDKHSNVTSQKTYSYDENGEKILDRQTEYEYSRKSFRQFFKEIKLFF